MIVGWRVSCFPHRRYFGPPIYDGGESDTCPYALASCAVLCEIAERGHVGFAAVVDPGVEFVRFFELLAA